MIVMDGMLVNAIETTATVMIDTVMIDTVMIGIGMHLADGPCLHRLATVMIELVPHQGGMMIEEVMRKVVQSRTKGAGMKGDVKAVTTIGPLGVPMGKGTIRVPKFWFRSFWSMLHKILVYRRPFKGHLSVFPACSSCLKVFCSSYAWSWLAVHFSDPVMFPWSTASKWPF